MRTLLMISKQYGLPYQTDESGKAVLSLSNQERLEILVDPL